MKKEIDFSGFTEEEIEVLRCILLERFTYYGMRISEDKISRLKATDETIAQICLNSISFNEKRKCIVGKLYSKLI